MTKAHIMAMPISPCPDDTAPPQFKIKQVITETKGGIRIQEMNGFTPKGTEYQPTMLTATIPNDANIETIDWHTPTYQGWERIFPGDEGYEECGGEGGMVTYDASFEMAFEDAQRHEIRFLEPMPD